MDHTKVQEVLGVCEGKIARELSALARVSYKSEEREKLCHCLDMIKVMRDWSPERLEKSFRWLGYIQGMMHAFDVASLDELKNMSRPTEEDEKREAALEPLEALEAELRRRLKDNITNTCGGSVTSEVSVCDPRLKVAERLRELSGKARFNEATKEELFELNTLAREAADLYDQLYLPSGESRLVERFAPRDIGLSIGDVLMAMAAGGGNGIHIKVTRTGISRAGFEEADFASITTGPLMGPSHMSSNDPKGLWEHMRDHGWRRLSREHVCYCGAPPTLECRCETCTNPSASRQWGNHVTGELTRAFLCCDNHISEVSARHRHVYDGTEANWRLAQTIAQAEAAETFNLQVETGYKSLANWLESAIRYINHPNAKTDVHILRACVVKLRAAEVKSYLESQEDKFRPPYGKPHRYVLAEDLRVGDEIVIPESTGEFVGVYKLTKVEHESDDMTIVFGGPFIIDRPAMPAMARKDFFGSAQKFELLNGPFHEILLLHRES